MSLFMEQTNVGFRWLTCGRRLFMRNPALLGGMGACMALVITLLSLLPMVGGMFIAFAAPLLLASTYLTIDAVSREKRPVVLHQKALRQSPRELLRVFRDEKRVIPIIVAGMFSMVTALIGRVLIQLIAGSAWTKEWTSLGVVASLELIAALLVACTLYFVVAWTLVYALPLSFLQRRPLFPAMRKSFKASMRLAFGMLVIMGFVLLPLVIAAFISIYSTSLAYLTAFLLGAAVLPLAATSLYCSYRTVFPEPEAAPAGVRPAMHQPGVASRPHMR